jgi:hypothetical protein
MRMLSTGSWLIDGFSLGRYSGHDPQCTLSATRRRQYATTVTPRKEFLPRVPIWPTGLTLKEGRCKLSN